ncbi:MAG TPA: TolC family protein [Gemmatimonadaceae bacterium]|nr:TolC family protein [Gemmatimonadaceae bacterium]
MVRPQPRRPDERARARTHRLLRRVPIGALVLGVLLPLATRSAAAQSTADTLAAQRSHAAADTGSQPASMSLQQAIAIAQHRGLAAQSARSTREAARWQYRAFGAQFLPQLSIGATLPDLNRAIIPVIQPNGETVFATQSQMQSQLNLTLSQEVPLTGTQLTLSSGLLRVDRYGEQASRLWQSTPIVVGIQQNLFQPNRLKWDRREQSLQSDIAERQYVEAREDVAVNTATAFFDLYAARMALDNATSNVAVNDTLYRLSQGRFQVGKIGENDLLQSQLAELTARNSMEADQLDYARKLAAFKLLLNIPADSDITVVPPADIPVVEVDTAVAVAQALQNESQMENLDLQQLEARRAVSDAKLTNGFNAQLRATAGFNQTAPQFNDAYESLLDQQTFSLQLTLPLIQWGAHHAQIQAAQANEKAVASQTTTARENIAQQTHFAALQLTQSRRQVGLAAKADTVGQKRFEVAKERYVIGKIGISDLYIAQNEKDAARVAYVQALQGFWLAYYNLRKLTLYDFTTDQQIRASDSAPE